MKLSASRSLIAIAAVAIIAAVASCASPGTPSGGPRDEAPPRYVSSNPEMGAVNVKRNRIDILFDEIVNVKDAFSKVVVSPTEAATPRVSSLGKRISIEFQDTLRDSTTYTIDFGNAIEDNNEGNKLQGFAYYFSTGPDIDSLRISGMVLDALTLEPQQGVLVGVYTHLEDTTFTNTRLERVAKTDDRGRFTLRGLKPIPYYLFSLGDLNNDYRWDNPEENIAFFPQPITPFSEPAETIDTIWDLKAGVPDTVVTRQMTRFLPNDILLNSFNVNRKAQYLVNNERIDSTRISLTFNAPSDTLPVLTPTRINTPYDSLWYLLEQNPTRDTLVYWIRDPKLISRDTLFIASNYLRTDSLALLSEFNDTLRMITKRPRNSNKAPKKRDKKEDSDSLQQEELKFLNLRMLTSSSHEYYNPLIMEFETPLDTLVQEAFHIDMKQDTVWQPVEFPFYVAPFDSLALRRFKIEGNWDYATEYRLTIDSIAATGIYGLFTAPLEHNFKVKALEDYSNLILNISGINDSIPLVVELLNSSDQPVRRVNAVSGVATFSHLAPSTYYVRAFEDINGNGIHDPGSYEMWTQPEVAWYYPKAFKLKANWDLEQSWGLFDTALDLQKPDAIKKNKPERTKLDSLRREQEEEEEEDDYFDPTANPFDPNSSNRNSRNNRR